MAYTVVVREGFFMSGKLLLRLVLLVAMAGCFGYLAFLMLWDRDPRPLYRAAEQAYEEGLGFESRRQFVEAAAAYGRALGLVDQCRRRVERRQVLTESEAKELGGQLTYLRAKGLRDQAYAHAAAVEQPLLTAKDSVTGENYRTLLAIPDAKERELAAVNLQAAALTFGVKDFAAQFDALRYYLVASPIDWDVIEKVSHNILAIKPEDSRAKYLLAKIDFEQRDRSGQPTPVVKRSRQRLKNALTLIQQVRSDPKFPVWRTEYLSVGIRDALYRTAKDKRAALEDLEALDLALLDREQGAIVRLARGEGFKTFASWDSEAVLGLFSLAVDTAIENVRQRPSESQAAVAEGKTLSLGQAFGELLKFCNAKVKAGDPAFSKAVLANTVLSALSNSQAILALNSPNEWRQGLDFLRPALKTDLDADRCDPARLAKFVEMLLRESQLAGRRIPPESADSLRAEAKDWLDRGFACAKRHPWTDAEALPLNLLAANLGFLLGERREVVATHLYALERTGQPLAQAAALLIDGVCDEREGRLQQALIKLEKAASMVGGDEDVRGNAVLANIYMALDRPDFVLINLTNLQSVYNRFDDLSIMEREWLSLYLRGTQNARALFDIAGLEAARRAVADYFRKNPGEKSYPTELIKDHEDRIKRDLQRELSSAVSPPGYAARVAWIRHLSLTKRGAEANEQWRALNVAAGERIETLALKFELMRRDAEESGDARRRQAAVAEGDRLIVALLKDNPQNASAQLYYAVWLAETGRGEQALAHLKAFAENSPPVEARRLAAAIRMTLVDDHSPAELLRHVPRSPRLDRALLDLAVMPIVPKSDAPGNLVRTEAIGVSRVLQANDRYLAGDYLAAIESFGLTLDFARIKGLAEIGLFRSVVGLAGRDPQAAAAAAQGLVSEYPNEPSAWLAAAYVALIQGDLGSPADDWERRKCMAAALNQWQRRLPESIERQTAAALTRAEFWRRAGRHDVALDLAKRAVSWDRQNAAAWAVVADISLDDSLRQTHPELRESLDELRRLAPNSLAYLRLHARATSMTERLAAVPIYEQLLGRDPADAAAYRRLVELLNDNPAAARKWIKVWRDNMPTDPDAIAAEIRVLLKADDRARANEVADRYLAAAKVAAEKRASETRDPAAKARIAEDARYLPQIDLARGFLAGGAAVEALRRLEQLPAAYAESLPVLELSAEIRLKKSDWPNAQKALESVLRKNPDDSTALKQLVQLHAVTLKDPATAREVLIASLKPEPNSPRLDRLPIDLLTTIGEVYVALGDRNHGRELLAFFASAPNRYPDDPRVDLYTGYAYELLGDASRARDFYDRALKKASYSPLSNEERNSLLTDASAFRNRVLAKSESLNP